MTGKTPKLGGQTRFPPIFPTDESAGYWRPSLRDGMEQNVNCQTPSRCRQLFLTLHLKPAPLQSGDLVGGRGREERGAFGLKIKQTQHGKREAVAVPVKRAEQQIVHLVAREMIDLADIRQRAL